MPSPRFLATSSAPSAPSANAARRRVRANCWKLRWTCSSTKGFAATRSEEVAARAGVSKGTLFLYFPSKEELFKAVVVENLVRPLHRVERGVRGLRRQHRRHAALLHARLVGARRLDPGLGPDQAHAERRQQLPGAGRVLSAAKSCAPAMTLLRRILQRGIDSGEFARSTSTTPSTRSSRP